MSHASHLSLIKLVDDIKMKGEFLTLVLHTGLVHLGRVTMDQVQVFHLREAKCHG